MEDTIMRQDHQLQLLQAQLKSRDEQLYAQRWQSQQIQSAQQREIDDLK
jgi:hypothetical protein